MQDASACVAQALAQPLQPCSSALSIPEVDMNKTAALGTSLLAASMIVLAGCDKPATPPQSSTGPMEKMGQKIDQAAERTKEQAAQATDKAGRALEDGKITAQVKAGILAEPGLKVLMIDVDTKEGKVTLTGSADSAANVQKAEQIASGVQGVKSVDNRLAISAKS
jgi:hyperosmotically inducible protein